MDTPFSAAETIKSGFLQTRDRALLLELSRLRKAPQGMRAVHILSSAVVARRKFARDLPSVNEAISSVIVTGAYHKIFNISSGDIVFIYSQVSTPSILALCTALETRLFLGVEPHRNVYGDFGNYKIFDLAKDINQLIEGVRAGLLQERGAESRKNPIDVKQMEYVNQKIRESNIRSIVFNQPVYNISHPKTSIEFLEFYTSIAKLEEHFVPDHSIPGNPWLFNIIKRELDVALMRAIVADIPTYRHKAFSLNLVVESFLSDGFREFINELPAKLAGRIIVEIEKTDLLQHSELFGDILERSRALKVALCVDGVSHHDLRMLNVARLGCAFLKLKWTREMADLSREARDDLIEDLRSAAGTVVLTRCDTTNSLAFARVAGISLIQGHLADEFFRSGEAL